MTIVLVLPPRSRPRKMIKSRRIDDSKAMLLRIVGMLTKLVERFDERQTHLGEDIQTYDDRPRPSFSSSSSSSKDDQIEDEERERERGGEEE